MEFRKERKEDSENILLLHKVIQQILYNKISMHKSNVTSISFTVEDDLISESSLNSTRKSAFYGLKPFSKKFGIGEPSLDERPLPNKQNRQIMERAQIDAYREMNENLFNPFQHKLSTGFIPKESDLYQQQKQRQIELLKKQEQQAMRSKNNYTIVFHNEKKSKQNLQMAGRNIIDGDHNIADYYNMKFKKNPMDNIQEENDENENEHENKKVNNFVGSVKKSQKSNDHVNIKPVKTADAVDKAKSKRQSQQIEQKSLKSIGNTEPAKKQETKKKPQNSDHKEQKAVQSAQNLKNTIGRSKQKIEQASKAENKNENIPKREESSSKPSQNLVSSNKNIEIVKKEEVKKPVTKKPPIPKFGSNNGGNISGNKVGGQGKKKYSEVYDGPDRNLVEQLQRQLVQCPTIGFEDIAELQVAKNLLQQAVLLPRLMPQFFQGIRKAMKGILLFGPPGTGKTLLAKAIAKDNIFFNVSASSLASKWKGQSQKMVRLLFQMAKYHSPSVIFFDEIDCIGSKRSQNQHESARKVKTQLLVQMDGVGSSDSEVFVLAATNRPWDLDQALRRRLQKRIYIPLPGAEGRKKMFDINLKGVKISEKINWQKLVDLTKGCSGADICNVCRDAAYMPMRRKLAQVGGIAKLQQLKQNQLIDEQVLESDLMESAKKVRPSVGKEDLKKYQSWMAQFGSS